jgi:sugar/nucleoside kinase (ribokinase family)
MKRAWDLMCAADLCLDIILKGNIRPRFGQVEQLIDDYFVELGGSATIFASQWINLGGTAGIFGTVGDDQFGKLVCAKLQRIGFSKRYVRVLKGMKTGVGFALAEPNDRAILTFNGSMESLCPRDFKDQYCGACRHWHVASFFLLNQLRPHWKPWLAKLKRAGITTSLDPNWSPGGNWKDVLDIFSLVDIFLCNETEARAITNRTDALAAGRWLAARGPMAVIKRGPRGAYAFRGKKIWKAQGSNNDESIHLVDTIGAGDCFDAGFVRGWQVGWPIERCLDLAIRCGRASATAPGGFAGQLREVVR